MRMGDMFRVASHVYVWSDNDPEKSKKIDILKRGALGVILCVAPTHKKPWVKILSECGLVGWVMGSDLEVIRDEEG